ncbi:hypothetical protein BRC76_05380 [Halobacteriales archaeon QH_8_67_36]|nr:MAG: hypothetical protein BRC76_05380 [Halobacteriales archaeon QH_8_67_36]
MVGENPIRDVTVFVSLYLVLSLPPFLSLNRNLSSVVTDIALLAAVGTLALVLITVLFFVSEGVERYTNFFFAVTDIYSIVVDLSFVLAATSWWLVPEVAVSTGLTTELRVVLVAIIVCQVPMVLFLSLMTVIGQAQEP